jgi:hypothetical protein
MYPRDNVRGGLLFPDPPKMMARNSPAHHFQFRPAALGEISLSAKEIDATAALELFQNVQDAPRGSDLQQSAVPDLMLVKEYLQGHRRHRLDSQSPSQENWRQ